mmetsp:Transcript_58794/g.164136  ORF Transcript_58794/g.164136 Transcript_58794/m.164136 type:complete len:239 (-) Transcript_58794:402-1118(-)
MTNGVTSIPHDAELCACKREVGSDVILAPAGPVLALHDSPRQLVHCTLDQRSVLHVKLQPSLPSHWLALGLVRHEDLVPAIIRDVPHPIMRYDLQRNQLWLEAIVEGPAMVQPLERVCRISRHLRRAPALVGHRRRQAPIEPFGFDVHGAARVTSLANALVRRVLAAVRAIEQWRLNELPRMHLDPIANLSPSAVFRFARHEAHATAQPLARQSTRRSSPRFEAGQRKAIFVTRRAVF